MLLTHWPKQVSPVGVKPNLADFALGRMKNTHLEHRGGLEPAGDGWGGFKAPQGWFEESLVDSRMETQFCREQRRSMELMVWLSSTKMKGWGPILHSSKSFSWTLSKPMPLSTSREGIKQPQ